MNGAQIHLALNHLPIALVLVGAPLLIAALLAKSNPLKVAACVLLLASSLTAIPVYLSGEPAEEVVEHRDGVSKSTIHEHEEAAEFSLVLIELLGALVVAVLLFERFRKPAPPAVWLAVAVLGFLNLAVLIRTAHLGGLIRHDEIGSAPLAVGK